MWWTRSTRVQWTCTRGQGRGENGQIAKTDHQSTTGTVLSVHHFTATVNGRARTGSRLSGRGFLGIAQTWPDLENSKARTGFSRLTSTRHQPAARDPEFSPKIHIFRPFWNNFRSKSSWNYFSFLPEAWGKATLKSKYLNTKVWKKSEKLEKGRKLYFLCTVLARPVNRPATCTGKPDPTRPRNHQARSHP